MLRFWGHFSYSIRPGRIGEPAIQINHHVDCDDIAVFQCIFSWKPVTDHIINRRTCRILVSVISLLFRRSAIFLHKILCKLVDLLCRNARTNHLFNFSMARGENFSGFFHIFNLLFGLQRNHNNYSCPLKSYPVLYCNAKRAK
ncbi:hypothetical protein D3C74_383350 [compost metagenome]